MNDFTEEYIFCGLDSSGASYSTVNRDGYTFVNVTPPIDVLDGLMVKHVKDTMRFIQPKIPVKRTKEDYIEAIIEHNIEKALIESDDIDFIRRCL